jgi:hypothetical protein
MKSLTGNTRDVDSDRKLTGLVQLVQQTFTGDLPGRDQAGLMRFEQEIARRTLRGNRRRWVWVTGFAAATAAAVFVVGAIRGRDGALTFDVVNGTVSDAGYVRSTGVGGTELRFSDGSKLALDPGTRTRVADVDAHGGRVLIENGHARVKVTPRPHASWKVDAGPYSVQVTGTEFDVRWSADEEMFDVRLHKGSVIVKGPLASAGFAMEAGQHLVANIRQGEIFLDGTPDPEATAERAAAPPPPEEQPLPPAAAPRPAAPLGGHGSRSMKATLPLTWSQQIAHGDFQRVLNDAEQRGLDTTIASASPADLAALADAARYVRRGDLARKVLLAERRRFPDSLHAREAAFFLGGLSEDESGGAAGKLALDWYERYLSESPRGAYVPQALGREMILVHKWRGAAAARPLAERYLDRFPDGPYAAPARKLLGTTP